MKSTISGTLDHVLLLARHLNRYNVRGAVVAMLMELSVPTQCVGFEFLKLAILLFHENPTRALYKDIYRDIMDQCGQSAEDQVDQAIREAIKKAWKDGSQEAWDWYFSYDGKPRTDRPSNAEFISRMARVLELWQSNCVEVACEKTEC